MLVIVETKGEVDLPLVMEHESDGDPNYTLLIVCRGNPKASSDFAKLAKKLAAGAHRKFVKPAPFKEEEEAVLAEGIHNPR